MINRISSTNLKRFYSSIQSKLKNNKPPITITTTKTITPQLNLLNEKDILFQNSYNSLLEIIENNQKLSTSTTKIDEKQIQQQKQQKTINNNNNNNNNNNSTSFELLLDSNNRFNFKNFKTLKYDIVLVSLKKNEPTLGFVKSIIGSDNIETSTSIVVQSNKRDLIVSVEDILLTIPTSHYRENREDLFGEFLDNMKNISEFYGIPISPLNQLRIELARKGFKELIDNTINTSNASQKEEEEIFKKLFPQKDKDPYSIVVNVIDSFLTKIVKSKHWKQLSQQVYNHFIQFNQETTKLNGEKWSDQQTHYDYIEITKVSDYCFSKYTDYIESTGDGEGGSGSGKLKVNPWVDLFHHYCIIDMLSYYDSFHLFDSDHFYCLTKEYLEKYQSDINFLQNSTLDKKIFLKYCSKILMTTKDQSFKPNTYIHSDKNIPDVSEEIITKEMLKSFDLFTSLMYRSLVISNNHSEFREIISNELIYPIKIADLKQLEYLLMKLGKIDKNCFSIFENRLKLIGNRLIDSPSEFLNQQPSQDQEQELIETTATVPTISINELGIDNRIIINDKSFSIDSESTIDIDDSVGLIEEGNGEYSVIVHISDATDIIKPYSDYDRWGQFKSSSIYLPHQTYFMLPNSITQHLSLNPEKSNKCLSFQFKVSNDGTIIDYKIFPSIVNNIVKTNYSKVEKSILSSTGSDSSSSSSNLHSIDETNKLKKLFEISKLLKEKRENNNNGDNSESLKKFSIHLPKINIKYNDNLKGFKIVQDQRLNEISNTIVSELMIATGYISSLFAIENGIDIPFRTQNKPSFNQLSSNTIDIEKLHPITSLLLASKSQESGEIGLNNVGHYSLSLKNYTWATSPIRRYPDILVHSQIKSFLENKVPIYNRQYLEKIIPTVNRNLISIKKLQRNCEKEFIQSYLTKQVAIKNNNNKYRAIILSNHPSSGGNRPPLTIFLLLDYGLFEVYIEEMIPISNQIYLLETELNFKNQLSFKLSK